MVTLSRSDLFLVVFAAIVLGGMTSTIVKATILALFSDRVHRSRAARARRAVWLGERGPEVRPEASAETRPDAIGSFRAALDDVRGIQEGAFLAGWRSCEECRGTKRPETEDHVMHHFTWRDAAKVTEVCARRSRDASAIAALDNLPSVAPYECVHDMQPDRGADGGIIDRCARCNAVKPHLAPWHGPRAPAECGALHSSGLTCGLPTGHAGKHRTPTTTATFHAVSMHGGDGPCAGCAQEWSDAE